MAAPGDLFVKVCGITRAGDAEAAASLGASAIGFIFWPGSPRYVAPESAGAIAERMPPNVRKIGVFVDETPERIREVARLARLDTVQLHGSETAEDCRRLADFTVIKAVGLKDGEPADLSAFAPEVLVLVDAHDPDLHGGTGRTVDWEVARAIAASRRAILSGGLNAENVARAVAAVRPYGIDVSSGVESAPGVKDVNRLKDFFEALHG